MQASESIYIFVTHEHYDHCDAKAIRQLEKPTTTIITNANSVRIIGKGKIMHNGDHLQLSMDISVEAVPAYNTTPGHLQYHPKGRDNGYILTLDGFRIYNTNSILAQCKEMYVSTKNIIRNNYPQDQWIQYGVIDKR